ncbi:MAG: integral rane sensor hybrid histidine kinase [Caulobacter sp.]|nr:integral rane sensor hybrid histidine kinase [Caulobacter sp.]
MSALNQVQPIVRAALARKSNIAMRMLTTFVVAPILYLVLGMSAAWPWAGIYLVSQIIELTVLKPIIANPEAPVSGGRRVAFVAMLAFTSLVFGAISVPLFATPSSIGPAVATLMLCGAILNVIVVNTGWRAAAIAAGLPHIAYIFIGPLIAYAAHPEAPQWLALWLGGVLLAVAACVASLTLERALNAEAEAKAEALRRQAEAEAAVAAKSAFVAMISHELRTPISAITAGAAELARMEARTGGKAGHARLIGDAGKMMRALLDDLLDLSRLDAHRMEVEAIPFDLRQVVLDVVRMWRPVAREKGLRLRLDGAAVLPGWVEGDPTRVRQVLNNLISNAIKFTRTGSVTLRLEAEPGPTGHRIGLAVVDTGAGMTPEQLGRLFTAFDQLGAGTARKHGGSGLGLFISRQLARLMGGDLTAASEPGGGATFEMRITLPLATPVEAAPEAPAAEPIPREGAPPRVLVVDDHVVNRQAVALMLEPAGIVPDSAGSAEEALEILAREPFDLVMMDVYMPDMDGREATRRLRAAAGPNQHTPVIAVTASATAKDWEACQAAGMTGHVAKPIDPAALYAALETALAEQPPRADAAAA